MSKEYKPLKIPDRNSVNTDRSDVGTTEQKPDFFGDGAFADIEIEEYSAQPTAGNGVRTSPGSQKVTERRADEPRFSDGVKKTPPSEVFVPKIDMDEGFASFEYGEDKTSSPSVAVPAAVPVPPRVEDPRRSLFNSMRELSWCNNSSFFSTSLYYQKQVQYENSKVFYKQAQFMCDYEDDYPSVAAFSSYYPYYQIMNYEQLRTYFTFRTKVRKGVVENIPVSYAFLYIYELLNNIGVESPADGLEKLMFFRKEYARYDGTVEKYIVRWLKDYHIYYELPVPFKEFIKANGMTELFPEAAAYESEKQRTHIDFYAISKYNITQSKFYLDNNGKLIDKCVCFVLERLRAEFKENGSCFEDWIFSRSVGNRFWIPFGGALFYQAGKQNDRRVVISENEVYICKKNCWTLSTAAATESGIKMISYILKLTESELRSYYHYKYKLSANVKELDISTHDKLEAASLSLERIIHSAVTDFYREENRTVVSVSREQLERIRSEALDTLEKLIVPEDTFGDSVDADSEDFQSDSGFHTSDDAVEDNGADTVSTAEIEMAEVPQTSDCRCALREILTEIELKALAAILNGENNIRQYAEKAGMMTQVFIDGINEKAFDCIGDNIIDTDDGFRIYEEYIKIITETVVL